MPLLDNETCDKILEDVLAQPEYEDVCVELGDNWEVIANIFYKKGLEAK